jgi:hypothetical protein
VALALQQGFNAARLAIAGDSAGGAGSPSRRWSTCATASSACPLRRGDLAVGPISSESHQA